MNESKMKNISKYFMPIEMLHNFPNSVKPKHNKHMRVLRPILLTYFFIKSEFNNSFLSLNDSSGKTN